ncbi:MAG: TRAP transporter small permease [bacterium]|nr:TRAP transporter small permease [bacterium]
MKILEYYDRLLDWVRIIVKYVMLVMTTAIFAIILFTVFSRYMFNYVISWSEEVPRYLLVWIGFLGAALAVDRKEHIGFDYLFNKLPTRAREVLALFLNLGIVLIGLVMLVYGIDFVKQFGADWMESIPYTNIWFYTALPISGALILLFVIRQELEGILALFNRHR